MKENYAIRAHNLSKKYEIGEKLRYRMFRDVLLESAKAAWNLPKRIFSSKGQSQSNKENNILWALKDINFEVPFGGSIGIVGNNGAGKSTLLKILSRVTVPTTGFAHLRGRVGSLLEVGTGFHPELTGRENVYLNGSILGMRKAEIDRKFDEIVAFSEIEKFLDTPVKFYSSGMRVRLAFSVAAHLEPEILLVDEVLTVGDVAFQKKSIRRMEDVTKEGRTVVFVSHNMAAVRSLCTTGIYLDAGKLKYMGDIDTTVKTYLDSALIQNRHKSHFEVKPRKSTPFQFLSAAILNTQGKPVSSISHERPFVIQFTIAVRRKATRGYLALDILDNRTNSVLSSFDFEDQKSLVNHPQGLHTINIEIPPILVPGDYSLSLRAIRKIRKVDELWDGVQEVCHFEIVDGGSARAQNGLRWAGKFTVPLKWDRISSKPISATKKLAS